MSTEKRHEAALASRHRDVADLFWSPLWPPGPLGELLPTAWRDLIGSPAAAMRVEQFVEDGQIVVRAELPGIDPDRDVEVSVDDGVLTIRAERQADERKETAHGFRSEFRYGRLVRQIRLPAGTTADMITARYADGVLEVRMPEPQPPTAAQIKVVRG
jgi:HSP20 family protein